MWSQVNRLARFALAVYPKAAALLIAFGLIVSGSTALAETRAEAKKRREQQDREKGRFAFSVAITSGVLIAQQNGIITPEALNIVDPPWVVWIPKNPTPSLPPFLVIQTGRPEPFGPVVDSSVNTISPNIGLNLEIMTPALDFVPGDPRFFVTGEILPTFAGETTVALQGAATEFIIPDQDPDTFQASAIAGTGSRLRAEVMTTVIAANAGAAFAFEVRDRLLRLKPSVGWIRWGVVANGQVLNAYKNDPVPQPPGAPFFGSEIRLVEVAGKGSAFFNAVGPGLELEMELAKRGPLRPVIYMGGFAYRTVGEDSFTFQAASEPIVDWFNTPSGLPPPFGGPPVVSPATYLATWNFQVDPWSYRAAIGFRLRWVGD